MPSQVAQHIHYLESRSPNAEHDARLFLEALRQQVGLIDACLLSSAKQAGLWLVESRWTGEVPPLNVPADCQQWSFEIQAVVQGGRLEN